MLGWPTPPSCWRWIRAWCAWTASRTEPRGQRGRRRRCPARHRGAGCARRGRHRDPDGGRREAITGTSLGPPRRGRGGCLRVIVPSRPASGPGGARRSGSSRRPRPSRWTPLPGMPPVVDPANLYSETRSGQMSPAVANALPRVYVPEPVVQRRLRDRSRHPQGGGPLQGRHQPAARRPVVGPQDPLGHQQRRGSHRRQPHAHRSHHRQARQGHPGRRSLQHVLHAGREVRGDRGGSAQAARLPRSPHHGACSGRCPRRAARGSTTPTSPSTAAS